jgi:hypothetical protein
MILHISTPIELFRYDLKQPPTSWNSEFQSQNSEYANILEKGPKNTEQFYFLHDNIETTKAISKIACEKNKQNNYWLTKSKTLEPIKILDFSSCECLHDILVIMDSLKINIYNSEIIINGFKNLNIQSLKDHNRNTRIIHQVPELIEASWFGQLLTDFQNGKHFKKLLLDANIEIDGYRWCENIDPYGLTYCFFQKEKLASPNQVLKQID